MQNKITKRTAFSLLELCVAIAVIAVIVVLSAFGISQSREKANALKCLNNLRSWHPAIIGYATDHGGQLPMNEAPRENSSLTSLALFPETLAPYANYKYPSPSKWDFQKTIMACPAEQTLKNGIYTCYGLNIDLNHRVQGDKARVRLSALTNTASYVLMSDTYANTNLYSHAKVKVLQGNGFSFAGRRHQGIPNFLFADGHVVSYRDPIVGWGDPGGMSETNKNLWFANGLPPNFR